MAKYQAEQGEEDRHGEMTGAITIGYILLMPPIAAWCVIAPAWLGAWPTMIGAVVAAVIGSFAVRPLARRIWAWVSDAMDRSTF